MITLNNVSKIYDPRQDARTVLDGINLNITKGGKLGILGRNGAGKSTFIRLICGAELPTSGHIHRGISIISISWRLAFGGAFQGSLSGLYKLRVICRLYGAPIEPAIYFVEDFSEQGSYLREPVKKYSSGMRERLAFAISIAVEFDCFLINEIVSVGDSRFHEKCHVELLERRNDRAMIVVSHHAYYIRAHCQHACVLAAGKLYSFELVEDAYTFYQMHAV